MSVEFDFNGIDDAVNRYAENVAVEFDRVIWSVRDRMVGQDAASIAIVLKRDLGQIHSYEPDDAGIQRLALAIHEDKLIREGNE